MNPSLEPLRQVLGVWEKSTAEWAAKVVRDPRTLEASSRMLRAHLLWRRSANLALEALWAPFAGTAAGSSSSTGEVK